MQDDLRFEISVRINPKLLFLIRVSVSPRQAKKCLRINANCADLDHPAHAQSIIRAFALHSYILQYLMILFADRECPDAHAQSDLGLRCQHRFQKHVFAWRSPIYCIPIRSFCACANYHPGLCSPFVHSVVSSVAASGQRRPRSDCASAQSDLGLRCPHRFQKHVFFCKGRPNLLYFRSSSCSNN